MVDIQILDGYLTYPCGCSFRTIDSPKEEPVRIEFDPNVSHMDFKCALTWDLIGTGNTKGVFQLESRFGQQLAKKLKPENIAQLAALTSIMRPGCIGAIRDNKNVADHYIDRKNGLEDVTYFHPALTPILSETYGEMIYQEQAMRIATDIAGFTLEQADNLRKAIGKKKADLMAAIKIQFITGCKDRGIVTEEEAIELFGWIEKSQRYSFNKSHAVSYAFNAYMSAYGKAHFPVSFFTSYLFYAKDKTKHFDEVKFLVSNSKSMGIKILPPDFRKPNSHFKRISDQLKENNVYDIYKDTIYFGLADIRGIGESSLVKLKSAIYQIETAIQKDRSQWSWIEFLVYFSQSVSSPTIEGMVESGGLDYYKVDRQRMLFEYNSYSILTDKERAWIMQSIDLTVYTTLESIFKQMIASVDTKPKPFHNKNRVLKVDSSLQTLQKPPYSLIDTPDWIARVEESRLGAPITATILDGCRNASQANCTCSQFIEGGEGNSGIFIAVQIDEVKTHMTKNDEEMAFVRIGDSENSIDAVIFPKDWESIKTSNTCIEENTVMVSGERSQMGTLIIKKMWQLT